MRGIDDIHGASPTACPVELGVVGWEDSDDHSAQLTEDEGGKTLVRVTLMHGRSVKAGAQRGQAKGQQVLCQIMGPLWVIPPKDQVVLVAFPGGDLESPGVGIVMGWVGASPAIQFNESRAVMDLGPDIHLIIKGRSVTLSDHNAPARFIQVGVPVQGGMPGISACDDKGGGFTVQNGVVGLFASDGTGAAKTLVQLTAVSFEAWQKDGSCLMLKGGDGSLIGTNAYVRGSGVYLGKLPTVANGVAYTATGPANVISTSVFVSP